MGPKGKFVCYHCDQRYAKKFNLARHIGDIHGFNDCIKVKKSSEKIAIRCPNCEFYSSTYPRLHNHLAVEHRITFDTQEMFFSFEDEFLQWKEQMEIETQTCFYKRSSSKRLKHKDVLIYYRCIRFGRTKFGRGKRASWIKGSCKTGKYCPAYIKRVDEANGTIKVVYCGTHTGHGNEIRYLRLPKSVETSIAQKLVDGVDINTILDDIRSEDVTSETLQKKHFLTKKKIYNIMHKYNLSPGVKYQKNDSEAVDIITKQCELMETNPIIMFKKSDESHEVIATEDMVLVIITAEQQDMLKKFGHDMICVDSTHNTNEYKVQLTCVYVIDEFGVTFPGCYCISSKVDEATMVVFFQEVKRIVGAIQANIFMSDDSPIYYNAWKEVMPEVNTRLLSKWHVDRAWRQSLSKLPDKLCECDVYRTLRLLLNEPDKDVFANLLKDFLVQLDNFPEFKRYFERRYSTRPEVWAACYHEGPFLSTNSVLEASHRSLKDVYLKSRQNDRLDYLIQTLLKIVRDKAFSRMIRLEEGYVNRYMNEINKRHRNSCEVNNIIVIDEGEWKVRSRSVHNLDYIIHKNTDECSCRQKCMKCNACVHIYTCSCHDYFISHYVCKHIHAIAEFVKLRYKSIAETSPSMQKMEIKEDPDENESICSQFEKENQFHSSEIDIVTNQISHINDLWNTFGADLNPDAVRALREHTSSILDILLRNSDLQVDTSNRRALGPSNQNFSCQKLDSC